MLTSMPSSIITYLHNNLLLPFPPYLSLSLLFFSSLLFFLLIFFPLFIPCILLFGRHDTKTQQENTNKKEKGKGKIACAHAYRNVCTNNRSANHKRDKQIDFLHSTCNYIEAELYILFQSNFGNFLKFIQKRVIQFF